MLVEAPTYDRPLKILAGLGAEIETVPLDDDGLDLQALERALGSGEAPAFLYTIPTFLGQATVLEFLRRGSFEPNLERVRGLLRSRRDAMLAALERELPTGTSWSRPRGGYFVWLDLPADVDAAALLQRGAAAGVLPDERGRQVVAKRRGK